MLKLGGKVFQSRLLLGSAQYPSPDSLRGAIKRSSAEIVTVSLRRQSPQTQSGESFWNFVQKCNVTLLPNTAGCGTVKEAVTTAHLARELFKTHWIKLEVIGDDHTLRPDPFALVEAARILIEEGFEVFPYTTEDPILADRLLSVGCRILMPWGSPIGSGAGIENPRAQKVLRQRFPDVALILDAGIGAPSHAASAMELGFDGVLLNTAVASAQDPPAMAKAFSLAVLAGRTAYLAGLMQPRNYAVATTPILGTPFWNQDKSQ